MLTYKGNFVLAARIKKEKDRKSDPVEEVEYMGGKPEGDETPYTTAYNELIEESGGSFLDTDWKLRATELHTFQPFSKKWIWCFLLELSDQEYSRLTKLDTELDSWDFDNPRDFYKLTGRKEPAVKGISGILQTKHENVLKYLLEFTKFPKTKNRMKDAKSYGTDPTTKLFECSRLFSSDKVIRRVRGFNLVILEQHMEAIEKHCQIV